MERVGWDVRLEERMVAISDLRVGMYVCRLDRDWVGTPFLLQGLMVESKDDIATLAGLCSHVFVDITMGLAPDEGRQLLERAPLRAPPVRKLREYGPGEIEGLLGSARYADTVTFEDELDQAAEAQAGVAAFATKILDDVRDGRPVSVEDVRVAMEPMVRSVVRNADAFLWVEMLRKRGDYDYHHAISCSALTAAFGRHVGFPEDLLLDIASGALLLDIGKLRLERGLLEVQGPLDDAGQRAMREHVALGVQVLDDGDSVPSHVREMILTHHERVDGSGYPGRLGGDRIPLLGRIAAVVDGYDAMISDRPYRKGLGRHMALKELYAARGEHYASEVVEQFMQCMSVYPVGSLLELNTGEVAIVMAQNSARRLMPKVMVLTTADKQILDNFMSVDLIVRDDLRIVAPLPHGAYGLDPVELYL